jgi:membrane protease YdiL (CAAX protease family)
LQALPLVSDRPGGERGVGAWRRTLRVALFVAIAYGVTWLAIASARFVSNLERQPSLELLGIDPFALLAAYGPCLAAVAMRLLAREPRAGATHKPPPGRWFLLAWLLPPLLHVAALAVATAIPGVDYSDVCTFEVPGKHGEREVHVLGERLSASRLLTSLLLGPSLLALVALGEEIGWRGYLYRQLEPLGFWRSSFLIGLIWGPWHAPSLALRDTVFEVLTDVDMVPSGIGRPPSLLPFTLSTVLLAPLLSYVRRKSGSVLLCAVMHGSVNATLWISQLTRGAGLGTAGLLGLAGMPVLAAADLALFVLDPGLRRNGRGAPGAGVGPPSTSVEQGDPGPPRPSS